jgi:hypothetical protein
MAALPETKFHFLFDHAAGAAWRLSTSVARWTKREQFFAGFATHHFAELFGWTVAADDDAIFVFMSLPARCR